MRKPRKGRGRLPAMDWPHVIPPFPHAVLAHFPIALIPLAAVVGSMHKKWPWAGGAYPWLMAGSALAAVLATAAGLAQHEDVEAEFAGTIHQFWFTSHEWLGLFVGGGALVVAAVVWWKKPDLSSKAGTLALAATWILTVAVLLGAWFGGAMRWES